MGTNQHRSRRRDEQAEDPDALAPQLQDALIEAGLAVGSPLGGDAPGRLAPRRGLDGAGRDVVIHLLELPDDAAGARTLRRLNELRGLTHPAIAPVRDVIFLPDGYAAVVVDLIAGADLAVVLGARGGLTRAEAARVLDDVGGALAHLHAHGLAHGDVSPANVMVTTDGGLVLIDLFGGILESGTDRCAAPSATVAAPRPRHRTCTRWRPCCANAPPGRRCCRPALNASCPTRSTPIRPVVPPPVPWRPGRMNWPSPAAWSCPRAPAWPRAPCVPRRPDPPAWSPPAARCAVVGGRQRGPKRDAGAGAADLARGDGGWLLH
ncbi:protein kinase domain-containing protein [Actinomyces sp. Z16]|uniref:protein kinase domain-containing protein n=1 Tax=Actinomyces sp. Z16 TaxID=2079536 RepID=UPI001F426B52|nr:protein kinase [Actinomyces sp. Z16]